MFMVAEGVKSADAVLHLADQMSIDVPICAEVGRVQEKVMSTSVPRNAASRCGC